MHEKIIKLIENMSAIQYLKVDHFIHKNIALNPWLI